VIASLDFKASLAAKTYLARLCMQPLLSSSFDLFHKALCERTIKRPIYHPPGQNDPPTIMTPIPAQGTCPLVMKFDFERMEFMIGFHEYKQAERYRSVNREARIYENEDERDVWLPKPENLKSIGVNNGEFALEFDREREA
jgi:hypothetical protein